MAFKQQQNPEQPAAVLIQSWANIYQAILDADNDEIEAKIKQHVELFPENERKATEIRVNTIVTNALSMSFEKLERLCKRCQNFQKPKKKKSLTRAIKMAA